MLLTCRISLAEVKKNNNNSLLCADVRMRSLFISTQTTTPTYWFDHMCISTTPVKAQCSFKDNEDYLQSFGTIKGSGMLRGEELDQPRRCLNVLMNLAVLQTPQAGG